MNEREFDASVRASYHFLLECKLARTVRSLQSHGVSEEFRDLSLEQDTSYRQLYQCGLRNGDYNCLLFDFGFLQFTFRSQNHYRMAYYPNPFSVSESEIRELDQFLDEGVISFEEYSNLLADYEYEITKPLIRFELDCEAYIKLLHPAAHFHIGMHTDNRWPVGRKLTPKIFTLLIAKLYYPSSWENGRRAREVDGFLNRFDRHLVAERSDCPNLQAAIFNHHEKSQFHFS